MTQDIVGTQKGDYEILALLGLGGMGQVYKVRNVLSDRVEAMKVLLPNLAGQKMLADRFIREIKVLAGLHHPNIAELRTALTIDNQLVMIMEFVEGATLSARVVPGGIPWGHALAYMQQVLAALSYAHGQKIIHRDIKPANMMLTPKGVVKLMDFGIARQDGDVAITATNSTVGSVAYMSPEQVKGEPADARSDLYSVGVSLYELITGQRPFQGETGFSIMRAHLESMPRPPIEIRPDIPIAVSDLILMAVAKDPARRFQSADAFSRSVAGVMPGVEGTLFAQPAPPLSAPTMVAPAAFGRTQVGDPGGTLFQATRIAPASQPSGTPLFAAQRSLPQSVPAQAAMNPARNNYRGFYIALGAMIVLVVLAAAGFYFPRHLKTQAAPEASAAPKAAPAASDATAPDSSAANPAAASPAATENSPSDGAATKSAPTSASPHIDIPPRAPASQAQPASSGASAQTISLPPHKIASSASTAASASATQVTPSDTSAATPAPATSAPADAAQLQEVETGVDQLSSRAAAVTSSLNALRQQQSAQGLGLRGDMVAAEQRMETNMNKAQAAIQANDAAQAKHYLDLAEPDVEKLEHFLGH